MRYDIFVTHRKGHSSYEFDNYPEAHRAFFKFYRKAQRYCPDSVSILLSTTGYDEVEGVWLMAYTPDEGLAINYAANEYDVF